MLLQSGLVLDVLYLFLFQTFPQITNLLMQLVKLDARRAANLAIEALDLRVLLVSDDPHRRESARRIGALMRSFLVFAVFDL